MSTNAQTTTPRAAGTERAIALATSAAPVAAGVLAPLLGDGAAITAGITYAAGAGVLTANYLGRLPGEILDQLPAGDILRAHRLPMAISTLTTGMSLGLGTLAGPEGTDALLAGFLTVPSVPGIVSLGWWAAVALVPWQLRRVLGRKKPTTAASAAVAAQMSNLALTDEQHIIRLWSQHISDPEKGAHRRQELTLRTVGPTRWKGTITAPMGEAVTVKAETVSSVYRTNAAWVTFYKGSHAGEQHLVVNYTAPADLDPTTLTGAWKKFAARPGGLMAKTHLEEVTPDPNTGGESAYVVADDDLDALTAPDRSLLAGALRTSPLLVSYEPIATNPRRAIIRMMKENPLEKGFPFEGLDSLKTTKGGRMKLGRGTSGHPAYLPLFDPTLGALHVCVCGATGSGKGGAAQLICLGYHANEAAIMYADPKGTSNPAVTTMAAHAGLRIGGAMGTLRLQYQLLQHRIHESTHMGIDGKNFKASKSRPWAPTVLDEGNQLLGQNSPCRKEAVFIVDALTSLGRSMGMPFVFINQAVNLDDMGGKQSIRLNMINGGSWVILRTDSGQTNLADLPPGFEGVDPSLIPPAWADERALVYDPDMPENDPRRTFGLGFLGAAGGSAEMFRTDILEDATPYVDTDNIRIPEDWDDWDRREELAAAPLPGFEESGSDGGSAPTTARSFAGVDVPKKELSAKDKIVAALTDAADPLHLEALAGGDVESDDYEIQYLDKAGLVTATGLEGSTLDNALTHLKKADRIHQEPGKRGTYGLGPAPADTTPASSSTDSTPERAAPSAEGDPGSQELLLEAAQLAVSTQYASRQMLYRKLRVGWETAGDLLALLQKHQVVGGEDADQECDVLVPCEDLDSLPGRLGLGVRAGE